MKNSSHLLKGHVSAKHFLTALAVLYTGALHAQPLRTMTSSRVDQRLQLPPVRITAGEAAALPWRPGHVPFEVKYVATRPPLDFPPRLNIETTEGGQHVVMTMMPGTPPGTYDVDVVATDSGAPIGATISATAQIKVAAAAVPRAASGRNPVLLLNGFQLICSNSQSTVAASVDTFGQLASLLSADGVPVAFFNNCAYGDIPIARLAAQLRTFINTLTYSDGTPVTEPVDIVAHSMGGLITRAYLAGLQQNGSLTPAQDTRVRKVVFLGTPHFGSFQAPRVGTQAPDMVPGSAFLWTLATWNQHVDDLNGVDAIALIGNGGNYYSGQNADDGVVSLTSGSLKFARIDGQTRVVPYCHVTPSLSTAFGMECSGHQGIADVDGPAHLTAQAVRSFLAGTPAWMAVGSSPSQNAVLSQYGGMYFAVENAAGTQYYNDLSAVSWGSVGLQNGGSGGAIYYSEFLKGTGDLQFKSTSLGTVDGCGSWAQIPGQYIILRCKYGPRILSVSPRVPNTSKLRVQSGASITVNGYSFGQQCATCTMSVSGNSLQVSSWTDQAITAFLPSNVSGFVTLVVTTSAGSDSIIMSVVPASAQLPTITSVINAFSGKALIAPNSWVTIAGLNLAPRERTWQGSDFTAGRMPTSLDSVSVLMNGKSTYAYYVSPTQLNVLSPPDLPTGMIQVQVNNNGVVSAAATVQAQQYSPSFFTFEGRSVAATHADGSLLAPATLYPGTSTPAKPLETVVLYANGFGPTSSPVVSGLPTPSGNLPVLPLVTVNEVMATVRFAGLVLPGTYQFNIVVPAATPSGDVPVMATYNGLNTQAGVYLAVNARRDD